MLLEWIGLHSPRFVCDCDIESSCACYRSCSEWVSCRHCRSGQSVNKIPKLTIHNPTSPLLLFANLHTLKRLSADNPSRPPPFPFSHHHLLRFWLSLAFFSSHPQHISLTLLELANSSNGSCNRRSASAAPCTCRNNKSIYFNMTGRSWNLVSSCLGPFPRCWLRSCLWRFNGWLH